MRAPIYIILFVAVLVAPLALRRFVGTSASSESAAAPEDTLIIVTPHNPDIRREFARAFALWHHVHYPDAPPVGIDYRTFGGTNDLKRLLDATYRPLRDSAGNLPPEQDVKADYDVVWGGGDFLFDAQLKPTGLLQPIAIDPALLGAAFPKPTLAGVRLYDYTRGPTGKPLPPKWIGVCLSSFGIVYNPDVYNCLGISPPQTWRDLTDPRLAGLVALADPTHSGSAQVAYMMVIQRCMADAENSYLRSHPDGGLMLGPIGPPGSAAPVPPLMGPPTKPPAMGAPATGRPAIGTSTLGTPGAVPGGARPGPSAIGSTSIKYGIVRNPAYLDAIADGWKAGMSQLLLIAANARYFTDSATMVPTDVGNGEAAAGMAIDFYGHVEESAVGRSRARFVTPAAATAITPDPVGILYGVKGQKRVLALHFIEFLLSKEGQLLWDLKPGFAGGPKDRALRRPPIRADLYVAGLDRSAWTDPDINPFKEAGGFNQRGEWMALMSDTTPLWAAAWIDDRDALRAAYGQALAVKDPARRESLIQKLADLPVTMEDAAAIRDRRKMLETTDAGEDLDEWRARERIIWAEKFREHFGAVENEARELLVH